MIKIIIIIIFIREYHLNLAYGGCDKNKNLIEFLIFPSFKSNSLFPPLLWICFFWSYPQVLLN